MSRLLLTLFLSLFSLGALAADAEASYSGIWRDKARASDFFVIQENGDRILLIALPGVEATGNTMRFSYLGDKGDLVLTRIASDPAGEPYQQLKMEFATPEEGVIYLLCDTCNSVVVFIEKVF